MTKIVVVYVENFYWKNKIPNVSYFSEFLDAKSFKLIPHMLACDALKMKNSLNQKQWGLE